MSKIIKNITKALNDLRRKVMAIKVKDHHKAASLNTFFSLFFNLLPFWAGLLVVISFNKWTDWSRFYASGEFYLYSTSLISSSYLIYHNNKVKLTDVNSLFSILSLMLIVVISILFATLTASNEGVVLPFIKWASIIFILLAIPLFYYSQVINHKMPPDVAEERRDEQQGIMDGLQ